MKFTKFLILSFIFVILTTCTVSASENITQNDILYDTDSCYGNDDFYISIQENYTYDESEWNSNDIIYISSYGNENGTFSVLVDDSEKQNLKLTNGYFNPEINKTFELIYPTDLDLDLGNYNIKINYNQNTLINKNITIKQKDDFDIYLPNPYYCLEDYWSSPSFIIIDSNHENTGTMEIIVNETSKVSFAVTKGNFEEIADCSNKSRYLAASDLIGKYGTYNIKIIFNENGVSKTLKDENVVVMERPPTTDPKLELYFNLYTQTLPLHNDAYIYLPHESTGTLTISYNGFNRTVSYSKGYATYHIPEYEFNHLGENNVTVIYDGDDFGTLTATQSVIVVPEIIMPAYVSACEEFTVNMTTHNWVNGDLNIYDYNSGQKKKLLGSCKITAGKSQIKLSSGNVGLNRFYFEFTYPGGDYPVIREIYVVENSKNITVNVPEKVNVDSDVCVTVRAPKCSYNFVYISVDGGENEFYSMQEGEVLKTVSGLAPGIHKIQIQYNDGEYINGKLVGDVYSNTFTVYVGTLTEITASNVNTVYNNAKNLLITLKDVNGNVLVNKHVIINLNGKNYEKTTDSKGQIKHSIKLSVKIYTATVTFKGGGNYLKSVKTVKITVKKATPKLFASSKTFKVKTKIKKVTVTLKTNKNKAMKNVKIKLRLNKKTYTSRTNKKGMVIFKLKISKKATYKAIYTYAGNSNYNSVSKTVKIKIR